MLDKPNAIINDGGRDVGSIPINMLLMRGMDPNITEDMVDGLRCWWWIILNCQDIYIAALGKHNVCESLIITPIAQLFLPRYQIFQMFTGHKVKEVRLARSRATHISLGFAFIEFDDIQVWKFYVGSRSPTTHIIMFFF